MHLLFLSFIESIYLSLFLYYKKVTSGLCARVDMCSLVYNLSVWTHRHKHRNEHMYVYVSKIKDENTLREGNGGMEWRGKGNNKIKQI